MFELGPRHALHLHAGVIQHLQQRRMPVRLGREVHAIHRAQAALALAQSAPPVADLSPLIAAVEAAPDDLAARFALANGQMAANDRDAAADSFLAIIAADRDWNESAARTQLLKLFEVVGLEDPWVSGQRRRLSAILFG